MSAAHTKQSADTPAWPGLSVFLEYPSPSFFVFMGRFLLIIQYPSLQSECLISNLSSMCLHVWLPSQTSSPLKGENYIMFFKSLYPAQGLTPRTFSGNTWQVCNWKAKSINSATELSWSYHTLNVWPWATFLTSLCLNFFILKKGIIKTSHMVDVRMKGVHICVML